MDDNMVLTFFVEETKELANMSLPDPTLLDNYNRLANRELFINYGIDSSVVEFVKYIIEWNKKDRNIPIEERKPIKIYINTDGGEVDAIDALISAIQISKTPVYTIGLGKCYSAGAWLLIAPPVENRYILPNTKVMIHSGSSGVEGDTNCIIGYGEVLKDILNNKKNYVLTQTKISPRQYKAKERDDWFLFADDCVKHGVCENVVTDIDILANL